MSDPSYVFNLSEVDNIFLPQAMPEDLNDILTQDLFHMGATTGTESDLMQPTSSPQ